MADRKRGVSDNQFPAWFFPFSPNGRNSHGKYRSDRRHKYPFDNNVEFSICLRCDLWYEILKACRASNQQSSLPARGRIKYRCSFPEKKKKHRYLQDKCIACFFCLVHLHPANSFYFDDGPPLPTSCKTEWNEKICTLLCIALYYPQ